MIIKAGEYTLDATLNFDPNDMPSASLKGGVDINSIDINNEDLTEALQGSTWFHSELFAQASFTSHTVTPLSDTSFNFSGDLTLRGITKPVRLKRLFTVELITGFQRNIPLALVQ